MLWVKAFHIIAMVAWFAGLFYLPRLFVYHADATDDLSLARFQIMERRLYYGIMWPAALLTTGLGLWLMWVYMPYTWHMGWMHAKLGFVFGVWIYHLSCGAFVRAYRLHQNKYSSRFYRMFNEVPTVLLIAIVLLVVVKPV